MNLIRQTGIHVKGLKQPVIVTEVPLGKRVQLFVYSHRSNKWYSQATPEPFNAETEDGVKVSGVAGDVVLGNTAHKTGRYDVVAIALDGDPIWGATDTLPVGEFSNELFFHRRGL